MPPICVRYVDGHQPARARACASLLYTSANEHGSPCKANSISGGPVLTLVDLASKVH